MTVTNFDRLNALRTEAARCGVGSKAWIEFATVMFDSFPALYQTAKHMNAESAKPHGTREQHLEHALRELVATIDLATGCMDGSIQSSMLDLYIENAEALLEENTTANLGLPPVGAGVVGYFVGTWIDASKELPDSDTTVFVSLINDPEPVWLGYHDGTTWLSVEGAEIEVIAWSDLPERAMRPVKEVEFHEG